VLCSNCGTENRAGRKFCSRCAAPLVIVCVQCHSPNEPGELFCGECASPLQTTGGLPAETRPFSRPVSPAGGLAAPAAAPVAERRLVTILFADLVGFTTLAEGRDAEDTRELLSRYFDLARDVIGRYGGTVEKFIGDAVMAVWGAPAAHEDDAERAVRAGLDLLEAVKSLGPGITARAGILTGEAAVTIGATNQGMVAGDLVNTASRLQSVAAPGTVLVGEATERAASKAIVFEAAGDQALKGKAAPVLAWRALRVVAERGGRKRGETLEAPFVGRDEELRQLKDLFHATSREKRARLVSVIGPAGIGKTRLAWEFLKYIDGLVENVWWHDGRSPAYGDGISFWALGEMVRERAGLLETDDEQTTRVKITMTLATHVPDEAERRWIEPALLVLLGVESGVSSEQLFGAWRTFFERLAATAPVVMVFEDFHFADAGLLDFVDHLLEWSRSHPIYVVTLARPELLEKRPDWGAGKRNFNSLYLEPLSPAAMRALLAGLVPGLPELAVRAIVDRADGIPLYAVETVRMLLSDGLLALKGGAYHPIGDLTALAVPETLTALIASRLDGLAPEDRALVSDAAVLGQSFTLAGLSAVSGMAEAELEARLHASRQTWARSAGRETGRSLVDRACRAAAPLPLARWGPTLAGVSWWGGSVDLAGQAGIRRGCRSGGARWRQPRELVLELAAHVSKASFASIVDDPSAVDQRPERDVGHCPHRSRYETAQTSDGRVRKVRTRIVNQLVVRAPQAFVNGQVKVPAGGHGQALHEGGGRAIEHRRNVVEGSSPWLHGAPGRSWCYERQDTRRRLDEDLYRTGQRTACSSPTGRSAAGRPRTSPRLPRSFRSWSGRWPRWTGRRRRSHPSLASFARGKPRIGIGWTRWSGRWRAYAVFTFKAGSGRDRPVRQDQRGRTAALVATASGSVGAAGGRPSSSAR
jgi:class 3 adenylate cyclase